jgi:galactokinase
MCRSLEAYGIEISGADLTVTSDVPIGAGLSSSAALEVSVGLAVCGISNQAPEPLTIVRAAHRAETEFVGTQSGIMDQYVSVFASANNCLLIDCRSLGFRALPFAFDDVAVVISDSGTKRSLATSEYNQRRAECSEAVTLIRQELDYVTALRDVTRESFAIVEKTLPETIRKRCRHVVTENDRTLNAADALERRDFATLGNLMLQSHKSLRFDYEVSAPELDLLVDTAMTIDGVFGSRMTGGGFGGCTITLLHRDVIPTFLETVAHAYTRAFSRAPRFFLPVPGAGARELTEAALRS